MITQDAYRLGGLLYMPVSNKTFIEKLSKGSYPFLTSFVLDLEDAMGEAGKDILRTELTARLEQIKEHKEEIEGILKFVRVRNIEMLKKVQKMEGIENVDGFIMPKFDLKNCKGYIDQIKKNPKYYYMPVLESSMLSDPRARVANMTLLKEELAKVEERILNIRVGGNDFSNLYGVRRQIPYTIYDNHLITGILTDVVGVFGDRYIISGPVCEYISDQGMSVLEKEVDLDILNGFTGKTAIHPMQVERINKKLRPTRADYEDAQELLNWTGDTGVKRSKDGTRMLEQACHQRWAKSIIAKAEVYGIEEDEE